MEKIKVRRRIHGRLTPGQQRRVNDIRKSVTAELPDLIRRNQLAHAARKENSLSGVLRRAVHNFPQSPRKIAESAGITWADLDDFLTGEKTLPSDALDRLAQTVKLKLPVESKKRPGRAQAS